MCSFDCSGTSIFVAGVIINELLLMVQGVAALSYKIVPYIQILLFGAAVILMLGLMIMFIGSLKHQVGSNIPLFENAHHKK